MTEKQLKYVANRAAGHNKKKSASLAGYGKTNTSVIDRQPAIRQSLKAALESVGVDEYYMAGKLKNGMVVKKESFHSEKKIPDNDVQQRYAQLIMRARGDIDGESETNVNLGIIQIPAMAVNGADWDAEAPESSDKGL